MLEKRRIFLLVICFAALCLSAAPAMADFVELIADETVMTVTNPWNDTTATTTVVARSPASSMDMYSDGNILQSITVTPYDLTATLDYTLSGIVYSATGSLVVNDNTFSTKIAADFVSTSVTFTPIKVGPVWASLLDVTGYLTPQGTNTSILSEDSSWMFVGTTGTISLANADDFSQGDMIVYEYRVPYGSLHDFLADPAMDAYGLLHATIHSTPIPAAVLLGIIGLGVAGLKLRKYA